MVIRGDLLRWAREQQGKSLREVSRSLGMSHSYLCEVELGRKAEIPPDRLEALLSHLDVTVGFARGELSRYDQDPRRCRGLAADAVGDVYLHASDWTSMSPSERMRRVLVAICRNSSRLTRPVLSYVLGLETRTLDALITGEIPAMKNVLEALATLTCLPEEFFLRGVLHSSADLSGYIPAMMKAHQHGISPEQLTELITQFASQRECCVEHVLHLAGQ